MLLFSTVLSINDTMSKDDFIRLAIEWNQGSPHKENVIPGLVWNGERNIRYGDDSLWLVQLSKGNISSQNVRVEFSLEDMDIPRLRQGATYEQGKMRIIIWGV